MFITPFLAAVLIGSFWTGVGTAAVVSHGGLFDRPAARSDVVITAEPTDHVAACHARYRSYQEDGPYADMWLGKDGAWHTCTL
jgi:hypothetical protein